MRRVLGSTFMVLAIAAAALAGCSDPGEEAPGGTATEEATDEPTGEAMADAVLSTADSELGEIVVDAEGMTVYYYGGDEPGSGESACEGECLASWPPVHAADEMPVADGVTAEVGTITGNDGELQATLDGRPLYLFVGDSAPGDVAGQGVDDEWWAVAPDGSEITGTGGAGGY